MTNSISFSLHSSLPLSFSLPPLPTSRSTTLSVLSSSIAHYVADIMSVGFFFQLLVHAISLAVYMLGIETNNSHNASFFISMIGVIVTTTTTYIYCFLSEFVTHELAVIGDYFYDCAWYYLPARQQKLFIMPIQRTHLEFRMTGLGIVQCSLGVFSSVNITIPFISIV